MSTIRQPFSSSVKNDPQLGLVGALEGVRIGQDVGHAFHALEERRVAERKIELGRVEDVKDDDLVPAVAEMLEPGDDPRGIVEQVGEDHHDPSLLEPLRQVVEDQPQVRLLAGGRHVQEVQDLLELRRPGRPVSSSGGRRRRR